MNEIVAYCGLSCHECGAFIATKNDDDRKRAEVAQQWSKQHKTDIKPEDINCTGCTSKDLPVFNYCTVCKIRKCCQEKDLVNCAYCDDYACDILEEFYKMVPDSKKRLDEIRSEI